ncbi:MAG: hypothetical protein ACUVTR_00385 [Dehalococcoidia bacterium]
MSDPTACGRRVQSQSMSQRNTDIQVGCYSGYIYAEQPRSFVWEGKRVDIKTVEQAWQESGRRLFRVVTGDGKLFELCYNEGDDLWSAVELKC